MKRNSPESVLREYVKSLSNDTLKVFHDKLTQRVSDDVADIVNEMSKNVEIHKLFSRTEDAFSFFDVVDAFGELIKRELSNRGLPQELEYLIRN